MIRPDQMMVGRTYRVRHRMPGGRYDRLSVMRLVARRYTPPLNSANHVLFTFDVSPTAEQQKLTQGQIISAVEVPADTPRSFNERA